MVKCCHGFLSFNCTSRAGFCFHSFATTLQSISHSKSALSETELPFSLKFLSLIHHRRTISLQEQRLHQYSLYSLTPVLSKLFFFFVPLTETVLCSELAKSCAYLFLFTEIRTHNANSCNWPVKLSTVFCLPLYIQEYWE